MMSKKWYLLITLLLLTLAACGSKEEVKDESQENATAAVKVEASELKAFDWIIADTDTSISFIDYKGDERTITKNPEKVAVLYNSLLGLWYYMDGTSICKVKGTTSVPEEALELTDLGSSKSVGLEAIIAMEPDLVVMASNVSNTVEMAPLLEEVGIETLIVDSKTKSYEQFLANAYLFGKIIGSDAAYEEKIGSIQSEINQMIAEANHQTEKPKVAALFATSKSITVESDLAQVGEMVALLGGENIYSEEDVMVEGETRLPFSIEAIISENPDVILISTMGKEEDAKATIDQMIEENPAWLEVNAVINERVYYLPKELSVYKPNQNYAEAFEMVAEKMYPSKAE